MRALQVAAVPLRLEPVPHLEGARDQLLAAVLEGHRAMTADAAAAGDGSPPGARAGARLVVLPALAGLLPLSALSGEPPRWDGRLVALARRYGPAAEELWSEWAGQVARTLGVYLCAGTVVVPHGRGFQHVGLCFGPDGRLLARQPQLHVRPGEAEIGLVPGDEWAPFDLADWRAGLVVGADGWVPEVGRWMSLEGVRVVAHPGHALEPASRWQLIAGPWQVVQQTQIYWVHAAPAGEVGGKNLAPRASVFAPCEITPGGRGWLADEEGGGPVAVTLRRDALAAIRERYPLDRHLNPGLYLRLLATAYHKAAEAGVVPAGRGRDGRPEPDSPPAAARAGRTGTTLPAPSGGAPWATASPGPAGATPEGAGPAPPAQAAHPAGHRPAVVPELEPPAPGAAAGRVPAGVPGASPRVSTAGAHASAGQAGRSCPDPVAPSSPSGGGDAARPARRRRDRARRARVSPAAPRAGGAAAGAMAPGPEPAAGTTPPGPGSSPSGGETGDRGAGRPAGGGEGKRGGGA